MADAELMLRRRRRARRARPERRAAGASQRAGRLRARLGPVHARPDRPPAPAVRGADARRGARLVRVTAEQTDRLERAGRARSPRARSLRAIDLLAAAIAAVKDGSEPRIQLELALLKAARPQADASLQALLLRIEQLERRGRGGDAAEPRRRAAPSAEAAPRPRRPRPRAAAGAGRAAAPSRRRPRAGGRAAVPAPAPSTSSSCRRSGPRSLERVARGERRCSARCSPRRGPMALEGDRAGARLPAGAAFSKKKAEANRELVAARRCAGSTGALARRSRTSCATRTAGTPAAAAARRGRADRALQAEFDAEEVLERPRGAQCDGRASPT